MYISPYSNIYIYINIYLKMSDIRARVSNMTTWIARAASASVTAYEREPTVRMLSIVPIRSRTERPGPGSLRQWTHAPTAALWAVEVNRE